MYARAQIETRIHGRYPLRPHPRYLHRHQHYQGGSLEAWTALFQHLHRTRWWNGVKNKCCLHHQRPRGNLNWKVMVAVYHEVGLRTAMQCALCQENHQRARVLV